ncbi:hypothetical protein ACO2Q1_03080 [Brevundimonas sp. VNH65]|uniref:hypothetical protein n=1 Tax=Brevundimonas sp. VNH65 TaxID=3400917 RepID=UPI003C0B5E75
MSAAWEQIAASPEDVPVVLAWETADRLQSLFEGQNDLQRLAALKGVSEFAFRSVNIGLVDAEGMASQLEAMAGYVRKNMK